MIEARHIAKRFRDRQALRDLNFSVEKGEILCIMGANGAGKSTLFNIIATLDDEYEGTLRVRGMDIRENKRQVRKILGYVSGRFSLYGDLTVAENLSFSRRPTVVTHAKYGGNVPDCGTTWNPLHANRPNTCRAG